MSSPLICYAPGAEFFFRSGNNILSILPLMKIFLPSPKSGICPWWNSRHVSVLILIFKTSYTFLILITIYILDSDLVWRMQLILDVENSCCVREEFITLNAYQSNLYLHNIDYKTRKTYLKFQYSSITF